MTVGMKVARSRLKQTETVARIEQEVALRGMSVFARIDHSEAARQAALVLGPTCLLIVGSAAGGTPLMQERQTAGIDLPLKILVWTDSATLTWVGYNSPDWIASRHNLSDDVDALTRKMSDALASIVAMVAA